MKKCCVGITCSHCSFCFNKVILKNYILKYRYFSNLSSVHLQCIFFLAHSSPTPHLVAYILKAEGKTLLAVSSQTCSSHLVYERSQLLLNPTDALYPSWPFVHDLPFGQMAVTERTFRDLAELMSSTMTPQDGFRVNWKFGQRQLTCAGSFVEGTAWFKVGCTSKLPAFPLSGCSRTVTVP